jgi:solute:Na+ symporter, SSS family
MINIDILVIISYLILIVFIGLWAGRRSSDSSNDYFLASKSLKWPVIGASLFASNISTVHLVGLAESGFIDGIVWGNFEWFSIIELIILAFVFIPFFLSSKVSTLPEFMEKRYDGRSRIVLAIFSIFTALFMHIGVSFYAGAVVFEQIFGIDIFWSIIIIALATGIYTIIGGLSSVVVTETVQTVILLLGSLIITILAIYKLPEVGINNFEELKSVVGADKLKVVSFDTSVRKFSFFDMLFGHLVLGIWYWCTDQTIVQRTLGASSLREGQIGALFAGFLKILPVFIMVVPGILAFALFKSEINADTKSTLPILITNLMPIGLKGLMLAGLLAAVMSSVAAALNSCSTLIVLDVVNRVKPNITDKNKIKIGKWSGVVILILAVSWSPFLGELGGIFELINQMFSIFAPSIVVVFLYGVITNKGTANAAFWTLLLGSLIALTAFIIEKYIPVNGVEHWISNEQGLGIHWLKQTYIFFLISSVIYLVITAFDRSENRINHKFQYRLSWPETSVLLLTGLLLVLLVSVYIFFY